MKQNVGGLDRTTRFVVGAVAVGVGGSALLGYWDGGLALGGASTLVGITVLATALTRKCAFNEMLGIDTRGT